MEGETTLHGLRPVQYRGMAPSLLLLSNGKGCFSLKLKIRAAISWGYPPPHLASSDGTWNTPVYAVTQLMAHACVFTQSLALSIFANLLMYIFLSWNRSTGQYLAATELCSSICCHLEGNWLEILPVLGKGSCSGISFKMGQKQLYDVQEVVLDTSAGQRTDCGVPRYRKGLEMN